MWVHSRSVSACVCVCLPVGVCACDRAPHCCSDVSSLCPRPMTVTPSLTGPLLGAQDVWASPSLHSSSSQPPALLTPTPHPPTCTQGEVLSRPADQWLQFGDINWTWKACISSTTGWIEGHVYWPHNTGMDRTNRAGPKCFSGARGSTDCSHVDTNLSKTTGMSVYLL